MKSEAELRLVLTSGAMPEQYEVYLVDRKVGYLRLRHGEFTVEYPDVDGELVYSARPRGDGEFYPDERDFYLRAALDAIREKLDENRG